MSRPIKLFFSYSHQDEELRDELAKRLKTLERHKVIESWSDRQIGAGRNWAQEIEDNLKSADIILLLVSSDFLYSDFCNEVELRQAMERHAAGEACVIPIILRPCYWQDEVFAILQALPKNAQPITLWANQDSAFLDVYNGIRSAIARLRDQPKELPAVVKLAESEISDTVGVARLAGKINLPQPENLKGGVARLAGTDLRSQAISVSTQPQLPMFSFDVLTVNDQGEEIDRHPGQANYFREELEPGVFLDMVSIPGGTFWMGEGNSRKRVEIEPFFMGKFAVTQAQWRAITKLPQVDRDLKQDPSYFRGNDRPVECISWHDAIEFCNRLSETIGKQYRLPNEAEWEYACRTGTTTSFHFGETITSDLVNYDCRSCEVNQAKQKWRGWTIEVGSLPPNAFGLYEMHGNVWEWCSDQKNDSRYRRGGSWIVASKSCRSASRDIVKAGVRNYSSGFRIVCSAPITL